MAGPIFVPCSPNRRVNGFKQARLTDLTIGYCGHIGIIVTGSPNDYTNALKTARRTDYVCSPCNIGIIITGSPNTWTNP